jgi:membrane dipeptidase
MALDQDIIVDAHQDIAYNAVVWNRDYARSAYLTRQLEKAVPAPQHRGIASTGLPQALLGRIGIVFGTLFVAGAGSNTNFQPIYETPAQAYKLALKQWDIYQRLVESERVGGRVMLIRTRAELKVVLATWAAGTEFEDHRLGIVLAIENADSIPEPKAFEEWYERGVRSVGLAWYATRYSGGNSQPGPLTRLGHELLEVMESFHAILDLSHMAEEAYLQAIERYSGPLIASHSNPRKFCDTDRQLSDNMIRQLADRGGVIGIVPYNAFLQHHWVSTDNKSRTSLEKVVTAIDYVCQLTGSARHVGIGSDFDSGFGAEAIPAEMDTSTDLLLIGPRLAHRGYNPEDISAILGGNFLRILEAALPE